ncbi:Lrp/AsnC family transcriptional regulator [Pseudofrankia sp. BMG5.37]|uniref:Lrp/AsnC family transcriptional regulator n=1 Tax=Pseudofrankia sp. BMG5.37 TaxID=3050035 RepID=UPI002896241D|nr:Lrp/AsnC family transcriptional regulator [Pseudofrankia sp. BMG5.37]MDT3442324.1 Lrp/AsnC family transcriptional regulator [Pseudofrankia sp. BMG5.37]
MVSDPDDLRIIRALQLAPRAPFARVAAVLGLPERTVARRYRTLRRDGILRIFGIVNPVTAGEHPWMVRVQCRPDSSEALAVALARRDDIAWVVLAAAGSEVTFSIRSQSAEQRDTLLTRRLPRAAHVLNVEASVLLHAFVGHHADDWGGLAGHLTAEEAAQLQTAAPSQAAPAAAGTVPLDPADDAIAAVLARDGRASYAELAAAAGISEGRATRRLAALVQSGAVFFDVDLSMSRLGFTALARLYMRVSPSRLHATGKALAHLPEVAFAAALSGPHNLVAVVVCRDLSDLYTFTTSRIGALDGVQTLEISPVFRTIKQAGAMTGDGRLLDPLPGARPPYRPAGRED